MNLSQILRKIRSIVADIREIKVQNRNLQFQLGTAMAKQVSLAGSLREAEFKVFSQFADDGIIQYLVKLLQPPVEKFVEFGVENYEESNTRFLLMNNNWQGLVLDGDEKNINYIKKDPIYWRHSLTAVAAFITTENINTLLKENGYSGRIGLLHIDIDGNDYWIWKTINVSEPDIVVMEYNSLFGSEREITIPYKADFVRTNEHYSNLYAGASLAALTSLADEKGYAHVGCNSAGNNAYFVKKNLLGKLKPLTAAEGFVQSRFREGRNPDGTLSYAELEQQKKAISGLPVYNTRTNQIEPF